MFTQKHFVALSVALRDGKPKEPNAYWQWRLTVASLAQLFGRNNPKFDLDRFLLACGVVVVEDMAHEVKITRGT